VNYTRLPLPPEAIKKNQPKPEVTSRPANTAAVGFFSFFAGGTEAKVLKKTKELP
jgi:hypothetical protein